MKTLRRLCFLAALTAVAAAATAGTAGASTFTSPAGTAYTGEVNANPIEEPFVFDSAFGSVTTECRASSLKFTAVVHGVAITARAEVSQIFFEECAKSKNLTTLAWGNLEFHALGNGNATVTSSGFELTSTTAAPSLHCKFKTNNTHFGTFTGSKSTGGLAILHVLGTAIPREATSSPLCGSLEITKGAYAIVSPSYLDIS